MAGNTDPSKIKRIECPQCGYQILHPLAWMDKKFTLHCSSCGWSKTINMPDLHEVARSIKEVDQLAKQGFFKAKTAEGNGATTEGYSPQ